MVKFFLADFFEDAPVVPFLNGFFPPAKRNANVFFNYSNSLFQYKNISIVNSIEDCDFILIPQGVRVYIGRQKDYIDSWLGWGKKHNKRVVLFLIGDLHHDIYVDEAIVFKSYNYKRFNRPNEIHVPVYVEDLLKNESGLLLRKKENTIPTVGFCGWAGFPSLLRYLVYTAKNLLINVEKIIFANSNLEVFKKGLYFRRKSIRIFKSSPYIRSNFIVRKSYSGSKKTISLSPDIARQEFVKNITDSDFVLCPKGDANTSARLYETMSLGRISVLIDTDVTLPLEGVIDYSSCLIRIPYTKIHNAPQIVRDFYEKMSSEEFETMQKNAREVFEKYLRFDSFFNYVFERFPRLLQGESVESFLRE